jgi:organic hydroperoxide reductase OsmC/OhrA
VSAAGPPDLPGSADPTFRGDRTRWNPEQLVVAALSQCHLLTYLHLCATNDVVVTGYVDDAHGEMATHRDGSGELTSVTLRPRVTVADQAMVERALALHHDVPGLCFIARSVNFPVHHEPTVGAGG